MITTKENERNALAQIRKIVEDLGAGSYIGAAFEGCFEIAEENIENDFVCSMKQRVEATVVENARLKEKLKTMELDNRDLRLAIKKEKEGSSARETALQERVLSDDDLTDCISLVNEKIYGYEEAVNQASKAIVDLADDPYSPDFQQAVKDHRNAKDDKEYCEALRDRIMKVAHQ